MLLVRLEQLAKWLFIASLCGLLASCWHRDTLADPDFYDHRVDKDPRQMRTDRRPFRVQAGEQRYEIHPRFRYDLNGVVVSMHHSDSFLDIYHHRDWQDYLNLKDICVIWGNNIRSAVYQDMEFNNTTWTCWAHWPNADVRRRFRDHQLSNNHLLADQPEVQQAILAARPGDQVRLSGYLAEYRNPANGFKRGTSTSRTDRGNGACETIYVQQFEIVQAANTRWRTLFDLTKWSTPISAVMVIILMALAPVRGSRRLR